MIPASAIFDQTQIALLLEHDPVVQDYCSFFSFLNWTRVDDWQTRHSSRVLPAHPETAYLKAFLVRIREGLLYMSQLHQFLRKHPLLIVELGFHLHLDVTKPYGFDEEKTLPCTVRLRQKLRSLDPALLQDLLHATVQDLEQEIPGLGEVVAFDVKHIYAWVKHNNPRVFVKDRNDKHQRPAGDPDCRLGVQWGTKRSTNQEHPDGSTKEKKEALWGYGSGVAAATTPDYGDVVLAEYTQPFHEGDATYFEPLYQRTVLALESFPTHIPLTPPLIPGMSIKKAFCTAGLRPSPKTSMVIPPFPATRMVYLAVPRVAHAPNLRLCSSQWLSCAIVSLSACLPLAPS